VETDVREISESDKAVFGRMENNYTVMMRNIYI